MLGSGDQKMQGLVPGILRCSCTADVGRWVNRFIIYITRHMLALFVFKFMNQQHFLMVKEETSQKELVMKDKGFSNRPECRKQGNLLPCHIP